MTYAQLVRHYGSEAKAVRALAIPQSTINTWAKLGIPHWRQSHIEHATNGKLRAAKRGNGS
jgi:DNA-binding transcriptional regulator YdaS (Cro superfamily)